MKLLKQYFDLQKKIYDYFGYEEDWVVIPLDDCTNRYWSLIQNQYGGGHVFWGDAGKCLTLEDITKGESIYSGVIYTQRFLPKWVFRGAEYTMVSVDTQCDGNKLLMVFDNNLEIVDEKMKQEYTNRWAIQF